MKKILNIILTSFALLFIFNTLVEARIYIDITSPDIRKVPMAVPYFVDKNAPGTISDAGRKMADLMGRGLSLHGFISVLPPAIYGGSFEAPWKEVGADFVVLGQYSTAGNDIALEIRLINVADGQMIVGRKYRGAQDQRDTMILRFCDEIILSLTGEKGISQSRIAFVSDVSGHKEIHIGDILGENIRQLTRHRRLAVSPRFSPDNKRLSYTSYHSGYPFLYITNLDQDKRTRAVSRRRGLNLAPGWSPDGETLAITLSKDGNPDLYLMNTKGVVLRRLTKNAGINVSPSWSPDGKRIAFVSDRSGSPQIYIMEVNSGRTRRLTFQGNDNSEPAWSPKGDQIAYSSLMNGSNQIYLINPATGLPKKVTNISGNNESPAWSPDGRQIVFSRKKTDGSQKLYVVMRNGSNLRQLFSIKGNLSQPQWSGRLQ